MKRQIKGIISLAVAICMSAVGALTVQAAGLDLENNDLSLTVSVQSGTSAATQLAAAKEAGKGSLVYDLYRIANVTDDGGFDFEVLDAYSDCNIEEAAKIVEDQSDEETAKKWTAVAQTVAGKILGAEGSKVTAPTGEGNYAGLALDEKQSPDAGLYLLVARSSVENTTVVKSVAQKNASGEATGESRLATYTVIGSYTYTIQPQLISIPTTTTLNTTTGEWVYAQSIELKLETTPATGSIEIDKTLTGYYSGAENATFVFQVDTYYPDETKLYASEVYAMTFTAAGTQKVTVDGLPIGATVKVSEVYSGVNYTRNVSSPETVELTVADGTTPKASFTNDYNGNRAGGGGVTNYFIYQEQTDGSLGWSWIQHSDGNISTSNGLTDKLLQEIMSLSSSGQTEGSAE